jgi:hypothetical protein
MSRIAPKLLIALFSAAAAALAVWWFVPTKAGPTERFHRPDLPAEFDAPEAAARTAEALADLPGPLETDAPVFPASSFRRWPLDEDVVSQLWDLEQEYVQFDPWCYYRHPARLNLRRPWDEHPQGMFMMRTNGLGLRMDSEPSAEPPDLRVLVAGDSHTDGVCFNKETFPALLEVALAAQRDGEAVEVLNAGMGGYSFYHYLGVLERFQALSPDVFVMVVYGGNDFAEALSLYHRFNRSRQPHGFETYEAELLAARDEHSGSLAQSLMSEKYFATFPGQIEAALQMARDVTTEVQVSCLRNGVHPIVVYLPPATEVEWGVHAEPLERVSAALQLDPTTLDAASQLADSYLEFLRERRIDFVDLRPAFRAAEPPLYWLRDQHINLRGHELVARELLPAVSASRPAGSQRVRQAPTTLVGAASSDPSLLSPGARATVHREIELEALTAGAAAPLAEDLPRPEIETILGRNAVLPPVEHRSLERAIAAQLYPATPFTTYDPLTYVRRSSDIDAELPWPDRAEGVFQLRTNSQGLRADGEPLQGRPDLRILVAGDGCVDGAFDNSEALGGRLAAVLGENRSGLELEALSAAVDGHSFYNYFGALKKYSLLRPDLFVVVVNGGNDFFEVLDVYHRLQGTERRETIDLAELTRAAAELDSLPPGDFLIPLRYFQEHRRQMVLGLRLGEALTLAMQRTCDELGIQMLVLYVPPPLDVRLGPYRKRLKPLYDTLGIDPELLNALDDLRRAYVQEMRDAGVKVVDAQPMLRRERTEFYWPRDLRPNAAAQDFLANRLAPSIARWFSLESQ